MQPLARRSFVEPEGSPQPRIRRIDFLVAAIPCCCSKVTLGHLCVQGVTYCMFNGMSFDQRKEKLV